MSSILFSNQCYIKGDEYNIRISMEIEEDSSSTIENNLLSNDNFQSESNVIDDLHFIQLEFQLKMNEEINSINNLIPNKIVLNKLISVKQIENLSNELIKVNINYIDISQSFLWTVQTIEMEIDLISGNELCLIINENLLKLKSRPKSLLVFVNPKCGKGEGDSIYDEKVLPLFEESNLNVKTIYTERPNHAKDYLNENSFDHYDGIVSVGGDGIFSEICFSVLTKTAQKFNLDLNDKNVKLVRPSIRLGVIPAGSTDALAFGITGHNDPITSALQILTGQSLLIDLTTVQNENGFVRFMFTTLAYGFFGDIIQQSQNWRMFGPARYNLSGFFQFIRNRSYHTQLTIIQPNDSKKSLTDETIHSQNSSSPLEMKLEGQYSTINCLNMPCRCDKSKYGMSPSVQLDDGSFDVLLVKRSWRMGLLRFLHNVANDGTNVDQLSNVERYRATQIIINPIINQEEDLGSWSCDGELIQAKQLTISAQRQALNLFASGINQQQIEQINQQE